MGDDYIKQIMALSFLTFFAGIGMGMLGAMLVKYISRRK